MCIGIRMLPWLGLLALGVAACGEKIPYPPLRRPDAHSPGIVAKPEASTAAPMPAAAPPPGTAARPGIRSLMAVRTPEGSFVVSSRPGGGDQSVRKVPGIVHILPDGVERGVRVVSESKRAVTGAPESRFVHLAIRTGAKESELELPESEERPDLELAAKADPDLAREFYHRESLVPVGMSGSRVAFVFGIDGFLGGAHPYASRRLVVVDLAAGRLEDSSARFAGRDLAADVLGDARETTCVRKPAGVAAMEGRGGELAWVVGLSHDVESCAGGFRIARLKDPSSDDARPSPDTVVAKDGLLHVTDSIVEGPVADWRLSGASGAAVLLMGGDRNDRVLSPWAATFPRRAGVSSREIRYWEPGMAASSVLGRASGILSVQFLDGASASSKSP